MAHWGWVLADRCGVVIGSDGFVNGFFLGGGVGGCLLVYMKVWFGLMVFFFFFLTWFCFWFDGSVVVLGHMRVVVCSLCCYLEAVWW